MDNINFASTNSTFDNPDLYVLSSAKEEMDAKRGLGLHRKNGEEEQKRKESLQAISSAIQERPKYQLSTDDYENKWNHNHHNLPSGCSLLPLHDQLSPSEEKEKKYQLIVHPKEKSQEEKEIHISESGEVSFSTSQPNLSMDKYNGTGRECDSNSRETLGVRELRGDECLDFFMPVEDRSPYQVSNSVINNGGNNGAMPKLQSLSDLVDAIKNDHKFHEFHEPTDKWIIDQEHKKYFSDTFGITNIHPLFVGCYGMVVLFLDDRGIAFSWCEMTHDMYILGFNIMEGLANFVYHPKKRCAIIEDTGELIPEVELRRRAREELEMVEPLII